MDQNNLKCYTKQKLVLSTVIISILIVSGGLIGGYFYGQYKYNQGIQDQFENNIVQSREISPVIDGILDDEWRYAKFISDEETYIQDANTDEVSYGKNYMYVGSDANNIYIAIDLIGDTTANTEEEYISFFLANQTAMETTWDMNHHNVYGVYDGEEMGYYDNLNKSVEILNYETATESNMPIGVPMNTTFNYESMILNPSVSGNVWEYVTNQSLGEHQENDDIIFNTFSKISSKQNNTNSYDGSGDENFFGLRSHQYTSGSPPLLFSRNDLTPKFTINIIEYVLDLFGWSDEEKEILTPYIKEVIKNGMAELTIDFAIGHYSEIPIYIGMPPVLMGYLTLFEDDFDKVNTPRINIDNSPDIDLIHTTDEGFSHNVFQVNKDNITDDGLLDIEFNIMNGSALLFDYQEDYLLLLDYMMLNLTFPFPFSMPYHDDSPARYYNAYRLNTINQWEIAYGYNTSFNNNEREHRIYEVKIPKSEFTNWDWNLPVYIFVQGYGTAISAMYFNPSYYQFGVFKGTYYDNFICNYYNITLSYAQNLI